MIIRYLITLKLLNRFPLLTKTQEKEIAIKSYNGNKKAKNTLILSNLRFVIKVAKRYINHYLPFIDLISEGNLGLIRAAETFNPYKGFTFISYAVHWIKQSILKAIAEKAQILKIPLKWNNKISQVKKQIANKTSENLDNIEVKKISKDINMKENDVTKLLNCSQKSIFF